MTSPSQLDIVAVAVTLAAAIFSPSIAEIVGPYSVILVGAVLGSAWSASRLKLRSRWAVVKYVSGMVLLAILITVPVTSVASTYAEGMTFNYLLAPMAIGIGSLGPDGLLWIKRAWFTTLKVRLQAFFLQLLGGTPKDPPNPPPGGNA